ncbi:AEC family transporter [Hoeflea poritis]|uniref:AEC family transporter n=1 Tax=Hoeflea poritis TaxID=2993659 RepID=A0ABT4VIC0_9HYPH|nr:AEC family transporter [Hoeflea poritis]MDA4844445.1 AEC family transporter [Hoeflea poritis]
MYGQILNVVGPIFVMTFVGYVLGRSKLQLDSATISSLVLLVATPCLIFSTLTSLDISGETVAKMALSAVLCVSIAALLGLAVLKLAGMSYRTFLPSLMMPNSGNIGLPLVLLAFGETGLALGISYFFVIALLQYTVGAAISSGQYRFRDLANQPLIYSILLVGVVAVTGIEVPVIIASTTELLGGMMIPAMLILLGTSLARLSVSDLKPAITIAIARLCIGLPASLIVIAALSLSGVEAGTVFLLAMMPTAIVNYVFAERYREDSRQVAGAVVVSTLLTFALLPALLWSAYAVSGQLPQ